MRHLHTDSHLRLAVAGLLAPDLYVDTLLGLARDQILAKRHLVAAKASDGARLTQRNSAQYTTSWR
jgi:hypothetical protein